MAEHCTEEALRRFFAEHGGGFAAVYLYGSVARGTAQAQSEVDVAVLHLDDPPRTLAGLGLGLEGELEQALGLEVQVVVLNRAPVQLVHNVLREGQLIAERDRAARVHFEVQARREYLDLLPVLRRYRRLAGRAA